MRIEEGWVLVRLGERGGIRSGSGLCVGLDPRPAERPAAGGRDGGWLLEWAKRVVDATAPWTSAYKANLAFYLAWGAEGVEALGAAIDYIQATTACPVILDAKWGDISSTAEAYADAAARLKVDAVTASVYMGRDSVIPLLEKGLFVFVLALPTNSGARRVVDHGVPPLYAEVALLAAEMEKEYPQQVGLVVGATRVPEARRVHQAAPHLPWLVPGVGAQGGDVGKILSVASDHQVLVNVSRAVAGAPDPGAAAKSMAERIGAARGSG